MKYLIAYDIQDDGNRLRVSTLLLDHGDRVQKSVFEAELTREELKEILGKAAKYLEEEDSLRVYPLCQACAKRIASLGRQPEAPPEGCVIV